MSTILSVLFGIIGIGAFLMAFLKDKPSTKKTYKIIAAIFVFSLPFALTSWTAAFNSAIVYSLLAIGLNILLGNAGQISLGHAAFYAIGAYSAGILTVYGGVPIFISIVIGGIITSLIGFILGTPVLRLKGHFLGIATLGLHVLVEEVIKTKLKHVFAASKIDYQFSIGAIVEPLKYSLRDMLNNWEYADKILGQGLPFHFKFMDSITSSSPEIFVYFASLIFLILLVYLARNILRTKLGRALGAIRDSEVAARALGINIALYKNIAFSLSAFYAGIAGGIFALSIGTVDELSFRLTISLMVLAMIIIGGLGTIQGAIIGAVFFQLLDMKIISLVLGDNPMWSPFIMGAALVLVIIFAPKGVVYMLYQLKLKLSQKRS